MTASTDLDLLPSCKTHGTMTLRPHANQSTEQRWCGTWYGCTDPGCRSSVLIPLPELRQQLAEQEHAAAQGVLLAPAVSRG